MEVELKLALDPADVARFRAASALAGITPETKQMDAIYLDTRNREIARNAMALRLRRSGDRWMQCLKAGPGAAGGLHSRSEWEHERPGPELDLSLFRDTPLAKLPSVKTLHDRLSTVFRVTCERTAWTVEPSPGTRLEVSLDQGEVRCGKRAEALCEVEIECLEGDAARVFDVALLLGEAVVLRPSPITKAHRGYRLLRGKPLRPLRAEAARVGCDMKPAEVAAAIVAAGLEQLQGNEEGLLRTPDPEFVHQARVAIRRMRSALRMFRKPIGAKRADAWRAELGQAARSLGLARDWDVFVLETLPAIVKAR
ncbi:MAG: inorganic triphosphatase, partial [Burkholderiales bacterium]|nr:inorganic triphosphatase [Burkholderiales bacterium]